MSEKIIVLSNQLRLVWEGCSSKVSHFGVIIGVGSRHEQEGENGLAHFIEHTLFKGTKKRSSRQIISALEVVGGEMNAFTSKEETCVYASVPSDYTKSAMSLMADIVQHAQFPEEELKKEREVIVDELLSYKDSPSECIFDDFEELLFPNNSIGANILGTEKSIRSFGKREVTRFIEHNFNNSEIVLSYVGPDSFEKVRDWAEQCFSSFNFNGQKVVCSTPQVSIFKERRKEDVYQTHCVLGGIAPALSDENRYAFALLINILGGPGSNAVLNMELREKHGLTYNNEASFAAFSDCGFFEIYFGVERNSFEKCLSITKATLRQFAKKELGPVKLKQAKKQIIGQRLLSSESGQARMLSFGKMVLTQNRIITVEEWEEKIMAIDSALLQQLAERYFVMDNMSILSFFPQQS